MGLNVKEILLRLCKVVQVSAKSSYTFLQRCPLVSGALLVIFILYLFLSYIYIFLAYLSPFLVCAAIFVRIFWSSEKTELKYVKKKEEENEEKKRVEPKYTNIPNSGRRDLLYMYPSQNATSRRRNFRGKKWDVYGGLEEKEKDLSTVFHNEFTKRGTENKEGKYFEKGESSLDYELPTEKSKAPRRQTLRSEPSMIDLVEMDNEKIEDGDDEDEEDVRSEEAQEDRNKAIEWNEDDQKNLMELGFSEMERNKRLESLIARRRARKLMKIQIENGLIDKKSIAPSHMAPLFIARSNPLDSPNDFEGLEMPDSAPSIIPRSPYDNPYDPNEDRPYLTVTGDSFDQELIFNQKDMAFCRHESFSLGPNFPSESKEIHGARDHNYFNNNWRKYSDRLAYPRFRWLSDKGNHDWLIDQLLYTEGCESRFQADSAPREGEETTHEEDGQCKIDMIEIKDEKVESAHETKSISDHRSGLIPDVSNVETSRVSEKPGLRFHVSHQRLQKFPASTSTINEEHIPSPFDKKHNLFSNDRRICHTPTYSIASDLQVEVSEVGSPASTVEEIAETNSTSERDSVLYDGDIDRDVSSGSEELWEASFHGRGEAQGVSREDFAEENNNSKDITSPISLRQIDEENVSNVSSLSSRSDMPVDTPTYINSDHNIFGYMKTSVGETEAPQSSNSPHVSSPQKGLMESSADHLPNEAHSEKPEEWSIMSENFIKEAEVINEVNNSEATDQNNTQNSSLVPQESVDEASTSSVASSPRSVLPDPLSPVYNQQVHIGAQQSNTENMTQETLDDERPPDTMPQNIQTLMDDPTDESHNVDFNHSQEHTTRSENYVGKSNIFGSMNDPEASNKEEHEKLKNEDDGEDNSTHQIRQETHVESTRVTRLVEEIVAEDIDQKSRELVDDKVLLNSLTIEPEVHIEDKPQNSVKEEAGAEPFINAEADMENYSQSESKELVDDELEKEKLNKVNISEATPIMVTEGTDSKSAEETLVMSDKVNNNEAIQQQLNKNETMVASESVEESDNVSNTTQMKEPAGHHQLENVNAPKADKPNDISEAGNFQGDLTELVEDDKNNDKRASNNAHEVLLQPSVTEPTIPSKETNEGVSEDS